MVMLIVIMMVSNLVLFLQVIRVLQLLADKVNRLSSEDRFDQPTRPPEQREPRR